MVTSTSAVNNVAVGENLAVLWTTADFERGASRITVTNLRQTLSVVASSGPIAVDLAGSSIQAQTGLQIGDRIVISAGTLSEEENVIDSFGSIILAYPLEYDHPAGTTVALFSTVANATADVLSAGATLATATSALTVVSPLTTPPMRASPIHTSANCSRPFLWNFALGSAGRTRGSQRRPAVLDARGGMRVNGCAALCLDSEHRACKAFQFKAAIGTIEGLCQLLAEPSLDEGLVRSSLWLHFNREVFCSKHARGNNTTAYAATTASTPMPLDGDGTFVATKLPTFPPTADSADPTTDIPNHSGSGSGSSGLDRFEAPLPITPEDIERDLTNQREGKRSLFVRLVSNNGTAASLLALVLVLAVALVMLWRSHKRVLSDARIGTLWTADVVPSGVTLSADVGAGTMDRTMGADVGAGTMDRTMGAKRKDNQSLSKKGKRKWSLWTSHAAVHGTHLETQLSDDELTWDAAGLRSPILPLPVLPSRPRLLDWRRLADAHMTDADYCEAGGARTPPLLWDGEGLVEGEDGTAIRPNPLVWDGTGLAVLSSQQGVSVPIYPCNRSYDNMVNVRSRTGTRYLSRTGTRDLSRTGTRDLSRTGTRDLSRTGTRDLSRTGTRDLETESETESETEFEPESEAETGIEPSVKTPLDDDNDEYYDLASSSCHDNCR
jgi:hypothetical protein